MGVGGWGGGELMSWRCLPLACLEASSVRMGIDNNSMHMRSVAAVCQRKVHQGPGRFPIRQVIRPVLAVCALQALNAMKMREVLAEAPGLASERLVIPQPLLELTTRYGVRRCVWALGLPGWFPDSLSHSLCVPDPLSPAPFVSLIPPSRFLCVPDLLSPAPCVCP